MISNSNNNNNENSDVAIIGVGFRIPSGDINKSLSEPDEFWNKLKNKFDGIIDATIDHERWNENHFYSNEVKTKNAGLVSINEWKQFDPLLFGISPAEASSIDPQQRLLLKSTFECLEDAGLDYHNLRGTNTTVYIGATTVDYKLTAYTEKDNNINALTGTNPHTMSNRISYCFDFRGQSLTLDTACSSSSNAIQLGYKSIIDGAEYSVCGGSNLILDTLYTKSVAYLNMTGSGYCRAFDSAADGFVRSEGCGILLLKKLSSAIRDGNRIYCVIKGATSNTDGQFNKQTFLAPSKHAQNANLEQAILESKINPADIDYFEAHGTGTPVGDPIEIEGISMTLKNHKSKESPLLIGSVKTNVGHLEPASGVVSLIKCCLMFKNRQFAPNIHFNNPNPAIKFNEWNVKVVTEVIPFPTNKLVVMGVNNFGATASNVCIILKEYQSTQTQNNNNNNNINNNNYLIPFSSNSKKSLEEYQNKIINNIKDYSNLIEFSDFIKHQIYCKSLNFLQRSVIQTTLSESSINDWNQFKNNFKNNNISTTNNKSFNILHKHQNPELVFVFCGQGPQHIEMVTTLYNNNLIFKKSMDLLNEKLSNHAGFNILEKLRSINQNDKLSINSPLIAQTTLFMVQVSLMELYKHWGINASYIVGHSFGELTSTYCAGMISLDDACYLVYQRARLQSLTVSNDINDKSKNFRMLVINISKDQFNQLYSSKYPNIEICCYNSPSSIVIGGKENQLEEILLDSKSNGIFSSFLGAPTGFHSSAQDIIKDQVLQLDTIYYKNPSIPIFSTVTGEEFGKNEIDKPISNYIYSNVREPVEFSKAINNIFKTIENQNQNNKIIFLELSPHPTLTYYIKQMIPKDSNYFGEDSISVLSSLNRNKNDVNEINNTISQLYCKGYSINFKSQFPELNCNNNLSTIISNTSILPRYQYEDSNYWMESERSIKARSEGPSINPLGSLITNSSGQSIYESIIDINRQPFEYLKGHIVKDKFYFPGAGYINSIELIFSSKDFNISYLEFKTPFILKERESKHLQTSLFKTSRNEFRISFSFKEKNEWVETSAGKVQLFNFSTPIEVLDINSLKLKCNYAKLSKEDLYSYIKSKTGLVYLNCFKRIEECYQGNGCTLSKLSLEQQITSFKNSFLDPSIIDSTLHGLLSDFEDPCQIVFDRIEDYKIYSSRIQNMSNYSKDNNYIWVYSEFLGRFGDSITSSLKVMLSDGTVIIEADKVVCTSLIPIKNPLEIQNPNNELFSLYWQECDSLVQKSILNNLTFNNFNDYNNNLITIITNSVKTIKNEKAVFRILQFISTTSQDDETNLSNLIINNINSTLSDDFEIDIEFTIGLNSNEELQKVKPTLSSIKGSLLLKELNLNQKLIENQKLKSNYYDIIILSNQITSTSNLIKEHQLINILNSKGLLIHKSNESNDNLINIGLEYNNNINSNLIISQKHSIINNNNNLPNYDKIIIVLNEDHDFNNNNEINKFINQIQLKYNNNYNNSNNKRIKLTNNDNKIIIISNIKELISINLTNNSIIYFLKNISNNNNQKEILKITMDYIEINQYLLKNKLSSKFIIISRYTLKESFNYLNSTILGARRYFEEFSELKLFTMDFDNESLLSDNVIETIEQLTSTYRHSEYLIRNNIAHFERIKKETNLKSKFKSSSYQDNNIDNLYAKLDANLEYQLRSKPILKTDYVEVKTEAVSINYKDNLIYRGLVPNELVNSEGKIHDPQFGFEFSGIVTDSNCKEFNIGDQVFGYAPESTSTHVYPHKDNIYFKPNNLSHSVASSLPVVYMTSLYCLFYIGRLDIERRETLLIHTGTGGVGLSAIEILKWKGFKSHLFVTVGSKEKEQYLIDTYGSFISGIYSTRDINYVYKIKEKLKQLGSKRDGIDLILNTLSNEYMDSNFKTLCRSGRIVDISVTHLNPHEYTEFNKYKYNIGYYAVEMSRLQNEQIKMLLKELSHGFSYQSLKSIPIKEFSVDDIKESIEFINERKLTGKIVVKMDDDVIKSILNKQTQYNQDYKILKPNYKINNSSLGKTILVTGQTGLILEILKWITKYSTSVETIIVLSKSNKRWELEKLINKSNSSGIKFIFKSCDISDYKSIKDSIDEIYKEDQTIDNVESIFHFAFQYVNHEPLEISEKDLEMSYGAKAFGAMNLHNLSLEKKWNLKQFILASSVTAVFGSPIQCGYTSSNYFLDALARHRRSLGLPAISTFWGLFESAGFISAQRSIAKFIESMGFTPITVNLLLGALDLFIQNQNISNSLSINIFNDSIIDNYENHPVINKIDFITNAIQSKNKLLSNQDLSIGQKVIEKISELLSIDQNKINGDIRLIDLGSNSLVIVSLKNFIDKEFKQNLFTINQLQTSTINIIIQNILKQLNSNNINNNQKLNNSNNNSNNTNNTNNNNTNNNSEFWKNEIKLNDSIIFNNNLNIKNLIDNQLLNIFLTGTSGYLGGYLLANLLKKSNILKVYCLIRNKKSDKEALELIFNNLKHHKLFNQLSDNEIKKIQIVLGDISLDQFGLDIKEYKKLSQNINLIINNGATTNLFSHYSECKLTNVVSTLEMIKFSSYNQKLIKPIVHMSSFSIFTNLFKEEYPDSYIPSIDEIEKGENGYGQSKIVSEYLLLEASNRGLPTMIIRLPFLFANPDTNIGNKNDFIQLLLNTCYQLNSYPSNLESFTNLAPITWISDNICKLLLNSNCWNDNNNSTFNLIGKTFKISDVLSQLAKDLNLVEQTYDDWKSKAINSKNSDFSKILILDPSKQLFNQNLKPSNSTIKIIESMNSNYNNSTITIDMVKNYLNYNFKNNIQSTK